MMRKELARYKIPADILIQSEEEVNVKKEITGHIFLKHNATIGLIIASIIIYNISLSGTFWVLL